MQNKILLIRSILNHKLGLNKETKKTVTYNFELDFNRLLFKSFN